MKPETSHRARLALWIWVLVAIFYFYLAYDYVSVDMRDHEFGEYAQTAVQLSVETGRPPSELRMLLLAKGRELSLPIKDDQIAITGEGLLLKVTVDYEVDINIPIVSTQTVLFRKKFSHNVRYVSRESYRSPIAANESLYTL